MNSNISIIHYKPLADRKKYYRETSFFLRSNLQFITNDDREELKWCYNENLFKKQKEAWKSCIISILPILLFNAGVTPAINSQRVNEIPEWARPRILKESEISLIYKHHTALLIASDNAEPTFILEDDALLESDTEIRLPLILEEFKSSKLDYLDLAGGCDLPLQVNEKTSKTGITYLTIPRSRTTAAYLISPRAAQKLASSLFPVSLPLDWLFQATFLQKEFNVGWCTPELFRHGSQDIYSSSIQ